MDFTNLTDEEYRKICNMIPSKIIIDHFKKYPKAFDKIRPGYRLDNIKHDDAVELLVECRHHAFAFSLVENIVKVWIKNIRTRALHYKKNCKSKTLSYVRTLSNSPFSDNTSAFFKLCKKKFSNGEIASIRYKVLSLKDDNLKIDSTNEAMNKLSENTENHKLLQHVSEGTVSKIFQDKEICQTNNQSILSDIISNLEKSVAQLNEVSQEICELHDSKNKVELLCATLKDDLVNCKEENLKLRKQNESLLFKISELENELKESVDVKNGLAISTSKITEECSEKLKSEIFELPILKPVRPKDMEEFEFSLEDNFTSIQVTQPTKYLLLSYISDILFCGKPIICHAIISRTLIGCIANALTGTTEVSRLIFSSAVDENVLREFLENSGRIVVLSNFLGNYDNESILMSLISEYKNKIIFLTHSNSKTLTYLSDDMFSYCHYVGLTKTGRFSSDVLPDSDSYKIEEEEYDVEPKYCESRFETILRDILKELHYSDKVINCKAMGIDSEQRLYERLAFDIVPYCLDALSVNPLNYSQTLQEVIKRNNEYAKLLEEWLG